MSPIAEIARVRERRAEAINAGSASPFVGCASPFVGCVTDDAVWLPPRGNAIQGAVALREWLEGLS